MAVLVTGGAGYIGSHTCVELLENNKEVVVLDNLSNSSEEALNRVKRITGKEVKFYKGDISDIVILDTIFKKENIESCIHFAGLKSVGESVAKPLEYYQNNIAGTLILLQKLREYNVKNIIFSSSATVYGDPAFVPITEECPKGLCTNPYGWSKSMLEQILMDIYKADETWNIILLRYFNPIGAHKSGLMGENPNGIPNNLMPYVTQVAVGKLKELGVFGNDYDTPDGTGVRDYIHVVDLAKGHVKALQKIDEKCGFKIYNLGTGKGYSVLDIVKKEPEKFIESADVLVVAGRGIKKEEDLAMIRELAELLDGQVACTRPLAEAGWVEAKCQVGLSGRTVRPKLIITCGVSGAIQFVAGMDHSDCIVSINSDEKAPIFKTAHYCLVGDVYDIVPKLIEKIKVAKGA